MCHTFPNLRFIIGKVHFSHLYFSIFLGVVGPIRLALEEKRERHSFHYCVEILGALLHHKVRNESSFNFFYPIWTTGSCSLFSSTSLTESFCMIIVETASCGHVKMIKVLIYQSSCGEYKSWLSTGTLASIHYLRLVLLN
ncbi:unnamed protein product [Hymenolepis diminuta]|uniref:Secreted protein n=1 Tax=Hymenolepis diminuta TaxID=6216 RepID=A0A0R3SUX5_HYMDI|nr:unnamed protein product [Hymenolepis diminuta]